MGAVAEDHCLQVGRGVGAAHSGTQFLREVRGALKITVARQWGSIARTLDVSR